MILQKLFNINRRVHMQEYRPFNLGDDSYSHWIKSRQVPLDTKITGMQDPIIVLKESKLMKIIRKVGYVADKFVAVFNFFGNLGLSLFGVIMLILIVKTIFSKVLSIG